MAFQVGASLNFRRLALLILLVICTKMVSAQKATMNCYNIANQLVNLADSNSLVILKNNKSCSQCFHELYPYLKQLSEKLGIRLFVLSHVDSSVLGRKMEEKILKAAFPDANGFYYDYRSENEEMGYSGMMRPNSLFYQHHVDISPDVIVCFQGQVHDIPYADIFEGTGVNSQLRARIEGFINATPRGR